MALQLFLMQNHQVFGTCARDGPASLAFHPQPSRHAIGLDFPPSKPVSALSSAVLAFLLLHVTLLLLLRHLHGLTPPTKVILDLAKCCFGQCNVGFYVVSASQSAGTLQEQKGCAGGLQLGQPVRFSRRKLSTPQLWPSGHGTVN